MAKDEAWGRKLRTAWRAYEERHDVVLTYNGVGEKLGKLLRRPAFKHSTVRSWFVDGQEPESFGVVRALATVLDAELGDLLADDQPSGAKRPRETIPQPDPTRDRLITDDEIERARQSVVRKNAKKTGAHRKRRGA